MINHLKNHFNPVNCLFFAICTYFLFPYTFAFFGFSPHVFFIVLAFFLTLWSRKKIFFLPNEIFFIFLLIIIFFIKYLFVYDSISNHLRPLSISFLFFLLIRRYFFFINRQYIKIFILIYLFLTIALVFGQVLFGDFFFIYQNFSEPASKIYAVGLANWSNLSALIMIPFAFLTIIKSFKSEKKSYIIVAMASSASIYYTMSRAGYLALLVTLITHLLITKNKIFFKKALLLIFVSFFFAYSIPTKVSPYAPFENSSAGRWTLSDYSSNTRIKTFLISIKAFSSSPLFGIGNFEKFYSMNSNTVEFTKNIDARPAINPHNAYTQFLSENGLIVSAIFIAYIVFLISKIISTPSPYHEILMPYFVGMMVFFLFHDGFHERIFWIVLGIWSSHLFKKEN